MVECIVQYINLCNYDCSYFAFAGTSYVSKVLIEFKLAFQKKKKEEEKITKYEIDCKNVHC